MSSYAGKILYTVAMNLAAKVINYAFEFPVRFLFYFFISFTTIYGLCTLAFYKLSSTDTLSSISVLLLLGIIAGILQVIGYIIYILHEDIDPNPVTWFMFAYGTAILTILEWDAHATVPELILPVVCAVLAIVVSFRCWLKARKINPHKWWPEDWWPDNTWERWSFISDIFITIAYVSVWALVAWAIIPTEYLYEAVLLFLFLSNLSTFPSFYPILRSTYLNPHKEHWSPWAVWAIAYGILGIVTFITHGSLFHPLMFYPVSNFLMHGLVAYISIYKHAK